MPTCEERLSIYNWQVELHFLSGTEGWESGGWSAEDEGGDDEGFELGVGVFPLGGVEGFDFDEVAGLEPGFDLGGVVVGEGGADGDEGEGGIDEVEDAGFEVGLEVGPGDHAGELFEFFGGGGLVLAEEAVVHLFGLVVVGGGHGGDS